MKNILATATLILSTLASSASAAAGCKLVDTRDQAVDNYLDINYPMGWSSHSRVTDEGDTKVFLYVSAASSEVQPAVDMTVVIKAVGNKYKCEK